MTEQNLKDYFELKLTAKQFAFDLRDSRQKTSYNTMAIYIDKLREEEFEIKIEHIVKLLDDTISKRLQPIDLNTIAFALISSDYFIWENESEEGNRISNVIFDLDNPDIGYDLTIKNIQLWREYLLTGEYRLDKNELEHKFRSNGKYLTLYHKVDEILWIDWDPIGINDIAPRDEYQSYTSTIFNLVKKNTNVETIANKLFEFETQNMGLIGNIEKCRHVAKILIKHYNSD